MYEYAKGNYVYYGNKECGSPIRKIKTCTDAEAKKWDALEKACKEASKKY